MKTVVLYGNSLVISSVGASLEGCPELRVLSVDTGKPDTGRRLSDLQPDVVIFDLAVAQADLAVSLWKAQPDLLLIGVDLTTDQALVLSSRPTHLCTTDELLRVIRGRAPGPDEENKDV
jgi:hypothetical protein